MRYHLEKLYGCCFFIDFLVFTSARVHFSACEGSIPSLRSSQASISSLSEPWWMSAEAESLMVGSCTDKNRYYTHQSIAARLMHYFPSHRFE